MGTEIATLVNVHEHGRTLPLVAVGNNRIGSNDRPAIGTRSLVIERRDAVPAGKGPARPHARPADRGMAVKNDFQPVVGHTFNFRATPMPHRNGVTDCEVLVVEPCKRLSYTWNASGKEAAGGLKTIVTWTLTPTKGGVLVRIEESGFRPEDESAYHGASYGWQRFIDGLERVVAALK